MVIGVALLLSAVALGGAGAAAAATPQDICADLADGHVDGTYTTAEWTAFFSDPTIQGYGCGGVVAPPTPAGGVVPLTPQTPPTAQPVTVLAGVKGARHAVHGAPAPVTGVQGTQHTVRTPVTRSAAAPLGTTKASGTLPFTGAQLGLFAVVGFALLAAGLLLRSTGRPSQRP